MLEIEFYKNVKGRFGIKVVSDYYEDMGIVDTVVYIWHLLLEAYQDWGSNSSFEHVNLSSNFNFDRKIY